MEQSALTIVEPPDIDGELLWVPRCSTAEGFAELVSKAGGLSLAQLDPIDRLEILTRNSRYLITVLEPPRPRVLVVGGAFFPIACEAALAGSSLGGSLIKLGWIGFGLRLEIHAGGRRIITSPVQSIALNPPSSYPPVA
jgi:hypothetical protein